MEATDSGLTLKVGVLLPNCPEYAVVVLGVSIVHFYQFDQLEEKLFLEAIDISNPGAARRAHADNPQPCLHTSRARSSGSNSFCPEIQKNTRNTKC